jgi:hypothetical protein
LKPQNSQFWYSTVLDWLSQYAKVPGSYVKSGPGE